jgi:hypothetical protein
MTRKDYALIAQTFADAMDALSSRHDDDHTTNYLRDRHEAQRAITKMVAETLASRIARHNPNFNATKFLNACQTD